MFGQVPHIWGIWQNEMNQANEWQESVSCNATAEVAYLKQWSIIMKGR